MHHLQIVCMDAAKLIRISKSLSNDLIVSNITEKSVITLSES